MLQAKGQIISNDFWMSSFEPKNEQKYFCISALASKMGQIIKIMAHCHANKWLFIFYFNNLHSLFYFTFFLVFSLKYRNILVRLYLKWRHPKVILKLTDLYETVVVFSRQTLVTASGGIDSLVCCPRLIAFLSLESCYCVIVIRGGDKSNYLE